MIFIYAKNVIRVQNEDVDVSLGTVKDIRGQCLWCNFSEQWMYICDCSYGPYTAFCSLTRLCYLLNGKDALARAICSVLICDILKNLVLMNISLKKTLLKHPQTLRFTQSCKTSSADFADKCSLSMISAQP